MSVFIEYRFDCPHCGDTSVCTNGRTLDTIADDKGDGVLRIDVSMALSQERFVCEACNCEFYTGDWDDFAQDNLDGGGCPNPCDGEDDGPDDCDPRCCCQEDGEHDTCGCHDTTPANAGSTS